MTNVVEAVGGDGMVEHVPSEVIRGPLLARTADELRRDEAVHGGPLPERGPCREYLHRECGVCRMCWRHGACTCGPERPLET